MIAAPVFKVLSAAALFYECPAPARGITINGLVILNDQPDLDNDYRANVIGGTGAFVMTAMDFRSYAQAILAKLIREIAGAPVAALEETEP